MTRSRRVRAQQVSASPPLSRRKQWLFRIAAATLVPSLLLCAGELLLRLFGYGYPAGFFLPTTRDGQVMLVENPRFGWRFFPPRLARTPQPLIIPAVKPPRTCRIFVFGESAAMGDPEPDFGPPRMLQTLLEDRSPDVKFEVVNVAMTAINSHAVREIARDCAPREGDIWVVYMGNNEVIGPFGAGTIFGAQAPSRTVIRLTLALSCTRLGQLLEALTRDLTTGRAMPKTWGGLNMFLAHQVPSDDLRLARIREHYRRNLEEIIRLGIDSGAKVIVSTVASNLKECAPFGSQHRRDLTPSQLVVWEEAFNRGTAAESAKTFDQAIAAYRQAAEIDGGFAALQFRLGRCLLAVGKTAEARNAFERARDEDTLRFRSDSSNNEIVRTVARAHAREGVRLADVEHGLSEASKDGLPGLDFFWEHVHFNFAGTYAMAAILARDVAECMPAFARRTPQDRPWLSSMECARRLAYCRWNDYQILSEIWRRHQEPPCTLQLDSAERAAMWEKKLAAERPATESASLAAAIGSVRAVVAERPDDWVLHKNLARLIEAGGDFPAALAEWRRVAELMPHYANAWYHLGNLLDLQGKPVEARECFERALETNPWMAEALSGLGLTFAAQQDYNAACRYYAKAVEANPGSIHAYINWGLALSGQRQFAQAIEKYRLALEIDRENALAHHHLGLALLASGQDGEAIQHFQMALKSRPDFLAARLSLGQELARRNRMGEALAVITAGLEFQSNSPALNLQLGRLHEQSGHVREAVEAYQQVLRYEPASAETQAALARLKAPPNPR